MTIIFDKRNILKDKEVKKEYDRVLPEFEVASALIAARLTSNLTQGQVAQKMGTTQSAIARLESGDHLPSLKSLQKLAHALNKEIVLKIHP